MNQTNVGTDRLLTISQVKALTGVKKSTIRHWEREFHEFLDSTRTKGNQRRFSSDAVKKIEKIRILVEEQGLTLRGVRQRLENSGLEGKPPENNNSPELSSDLSKGVQELADLMSEHLLRRLFKGN